jgi:hypothetical protein
MDLLTFDRHRLVYARRMSNRREDYFNYLVFATGALAAILIALAGLNYLGVI